MRFSLAWTKVTQYCATHKRVVSARRMGYAWIALVVDSNPINQQVTRENDLLQHVQQWHERRSNRRVLAGARRILASIAA
jgi:hypothetical protein